MKTLPFEKSRAHPGPHMSAPELSCSQLFTCTNSQSKSGLVQTLFKMAVLKIPPQLRGFLELSGVSSLIRPDDEGESWRRGTSQLQVGL